MLPVRGVCSLVDQDEDHVLQLIEDGSIAWAFDVALDTKRGRNRELRNPAGSGRMLSQTATMRTEVGWCNRAPVARCPDDLGM